MNESTPELKNFAISLEDESRYYFSIHPFEITNALGIVVAVLQEYSIISSTGEKYKLYKTKEGNWYDYHEIPFESQVLLRGLKRAIDQL